MIDHAQQQLKDIQHGDMLYRITFINQLFFQSSAKWQIYDKLLSSLQSPAVFACDVAKHW